MFPKYSAFHQDNNFAGRESREADQLIHDAQERRVQQREAALRKEARIPVSDLEDMVHELRAIPMTLDIDDIALNEAVDSLAERMASYFSG